MSSRFWFDTVSTPLESVPVSVYKSIIGNRSCMLKHIIGSPDNLHFSFDLKCHPQPPPFTCQCPKCGKVSAFCIPLPVPSILSVTDGCFSFLPLVPSHTHFLVSSKVLGFSIQLSCLSMMTISWLPVWTLQLAMLPFLLPPVFYISVFPPHTAITLWGKQLNSLIFFQVQSAWKKTQTFKNILIIFQKFCCRDTTIYICSD